jgi:hypothetical protein
VQQHLKSELRDVVSEFDSPTDVSAHKQPAPMLPPKDDAPPLEAPVAPTVASSDAAALEAPSPNGAPLPTPEPDAPSESA